MLSQQELNRAVAEFDRAGLQVEIHAIGDGAIRMSLDAYENAAKVNGPRDRRHRVEHVEVPCRGGRAAIPRARRHRVDAADRCDAGRRHDGELRPAARAGAFVARL